VTCACLMSAEMLLFVGLDDGSTVIWDCHLVTQVRERSAPCLLKYNGPRRTWNLRALFESVRTSKTALRKVGFRARDSNFPTAFLFHVLRLHV